MFRTKANVWIRKSYNRKWHSTTAEVQSTKLIPTDTKHVLEDSFGRHHTYLRISLTERCNLRCRYCMPEDGIFLTPKSDLLNTSEILQLATLFVKQGVTKIRLTGGEPTVHKDLRFIIEYLRDLKGLDTIGMTTNGLTLIRQLEGLQKAGLNALNVSLDTLQEKKFEEVARRKGWCKVMAGIEHALHLTYSPVKINCVVMKDFNDNEILDFVELTRTKNIHVRFIEYMPFGGNKWNSTKLITSADLIRKIRLRYPNFEAVIGGSNDTSRQYKVPTFCGQVGFISSISDNFCSSCNRVRLLADGSFKVCLLGSAEISLRDALRNGCSEEDILMLIHAALMKKKKQHAGTSKMLSSYPNKNESCGRIFTLSINFPTVTGLFAFKFGNKIPFLLPVSHTSSICRPRNYSSLNHISSTGKATMVDVGEKPSTLRCASAYAEVHVGKQIIELIRDNNVKKGDVLSVAKLAGIMGAKKTAELIPLCHNIALSFANVTLEVDAVTNRVKIFSEIRCRNQTGVEMEALTAVTIAALTVYDMCKAVSHHITIENVQLTKKTGGKSDFNRG